MEAGNKPSELKYNAKSRGPHHLCFTTSDYAESGNIKVFFNVDFKSRTIRGGSISTKVNSNELPTVEVREQSRCVVLCLTYCNIDFSYSSCVGLTIPFVCVIIEQLNACGGIDP